MGFRAQPEGADPDAGGFARQVGRGEAAGPRITQLSDRVVVLPSLDYLELLGSMYLQGQQFGAQFQVAIVDGELFGRMQRSLQLLSAGVVSRGEAGLA
jgi:hypothetical protein